MRELTEAERFYTSQFKCPHCRTMTLLEGPRGGCSVNVRCSRCDCRLNILDPDMAPAVPWGQMLDEPYGYLPPSGLRLWWDKLRRRLRRRRR